jgi:hypothetical protein
MLVLNIAYWEIVLVVTNPIILSTAIMGEILLSDYFS